MSQKAFVLLWLALVREAVEAGVSESGGNNRGKQVEKYLRACGCDPGQPWCMAFLIFYALKAYAVQVKKLSLTSDTIVAVLRTLWGGLKTNYGILVTGSCGEQMRYQARRGKVVYREDVTEILPGHVCLWAWTERDVQYRKPAHVSMCNKRWTREEGGDIEDLEGNTPSGSGNQSDGDGAHQRKRSFKNLVCVIETY